MMAREQIKQALAAWSEIQLLRTDCLRLLVDDDRAKRHFRLCNQFKLAEPYLATVTSEAKH